MSRFSRAAGDDQQNADRALARVAWYYYRDNMTQAEIAAQLHISRPTVARMLERARQSGIVTIDIDTSSIGGVELNTEIAAKYGLDDILIVPHHAEPAPSPAAIPAEATNSRVALEAAQYMKRFLQPDAVIGVGWGDSVSRTLQALRRPLLDGVTFATLTGGIAAYTARVDGATDNGVANFVKFVPAPLLASNSSIASAFRVEPAVTSVLDLARSADATLVGIGGAISSATILRDGVLTESQLREYRRKGAVGDILAEWFDEHGQVLDVGLKDMRIGIEISELRQMRCVIGVAGGMDKLQAIRGALAGSYLNVLVTTEDVARSLVSS